MDTYAPEPGYGSIVRDRAGRTYQHVVPPESSEMFPGHWHALNELAIAFEPTEFTWMSLCEQRGPLYAVAVIHNQP